MPMPVRNTPVLALAVSKSAKSIWERFNTELTERISGAVDVQEVVHNTRGQVAIAERVQRRVVELSDVANNHSGCEQTNVLETVLLGALSAGNGVLGGCGK